ncbi:MAG: polynucleotide kinase-phosphatase, partial [Chloroflexota bacterium]|nr:polynucleotide kinase-phosphatase [Chloroflexota bacterium]
MKLSIPAPSLILLIGPSGAGKSTFARAHFKATEILSSDAFRGMVADDENDQGATKDAFDLLHAVTAARLVRGRLTVIDATNVQREARRPLIELARRFHVLPVAIVLDLPERVSLERNRARPDRQFGPHVVRRQRDQLRQGLKGLQREGFRTVHVLSSPEEVAAATIERRPLWVDRRDLHGPFDIIGDVHGCFDELRELLEKLGYRVEARPEEDGARGWVVEPPPGRMAVFVGDLVDRGPKTPDALKLAMAMTAAGTALCVPGNHDDKLMRALKGRKVKIAHGLAESLAQLAAEPPAFRDRVVAFLDGLVSHYALDGGKLVVAHAGMKEELQGRASGAVRDFALYGETTGETDAFGLPVRLDWAAGYRGEAMVVYGHTPIPEPDWVNRTINIDTGCVFGGRLTALRYPELELVSVPARRTYAESARPFLPVKPDEAVGEPGPTAQQAADDLLDLEDVLGKRAVETRLAGRVTIREENAAALEVMARFAVDPRWLVYLPPTMSPSETSRREGLLEHPAEAFAHYRNQGVKRVVCEEKHMGSRAVLVVCRDEDVARRRFGADDERAGICYTRTGRPFFADGELEEALLERTRDAIGAAGLWEELATDWVCLDAELMPWSLKADDLLREQYAAVGAAGRAALAEADAVLETTTARDGELVGPRNETRARGELVDRYAAAYRRYCWPVAAVEDLRLAPFHLLASEGAVHVDKPHDWHLATLARLAPSGVRPPLMATAWRTVDLGDAVSEAEAIGWWTALTDGGGEGFVVKPVGFVERGRRGLVQPALKVRGREYLRLIYGPE